MSSLIGRKDIWPATNCAYEADGEFWISNFDFLFAFISNNSSISDSFGDSKTFFALIKVFFIVPFCLRGGDSKLNLIN